MDGFPNNDCDYDSLSTLTQVHYEAFVHNICGRNLVGLQSLVVSDVNEQI